MELDVEDVEDEERRRYSLDSCDGSFSERVLSRHTFVSASEFDVDDEGAPLRTRSQSRPSSRRRSLLERAPKLPRIDVRDDHCLGKLGRHLDSFAPAPLHRRLSAAFHTDSRCAVVY